MVSASVQANSPGRILLDVALYLSHRVLITNSLALAVLLALCTDVEDEGRRTDYSPPTMPASGSPKLNPGNPYPAPTPNPTFGVVLPLPTLPAAFIPIAPTAPIAAANRGLELDDGDAWPCAGEAAPGAGDVLPLAADGGALCAKHHWRRRAA